MITFNDFSSSFSDLRERLNDQDRASYFTMRKQLTPRYLRTWTEIILQWLLLGASIAITKLVTDVTFWNVLIFAMLFSVLIHRLHLFLHEGSHYNLAPTKPLNDLLTNLLLGALVVTDVASYREQHVLHHRNLGLPTDPERSYQSRFDLKFVVRNLLGLSVLEIAVRRNMGFSKSKKSWVIPTGITLHVAVVLLGALAGNFLLPISWIVAVACFFPLIAATRQLLEHRPVLGHNLETKFPLTRIFRRGFFTFVFGAAGFDRHLLHHWDPGIPCSRLSEFERELEKAGLGQLLNARRTTYVKVAASVWQQ
jgi:fatty acid desaturase